MLASWWHNPLSAGQLVAWFAVSWSVGFVIHRQLFSWRHDSLSAGQLAAWFTVSWSVGGVIHCQLVSWPRDSLSAGQLAAWFTVSWSVGGMIYCQLVSWRHDLLLAGQLAAWFASDLCVLACQSTARDIWRLCWFVPSCSAHIIYVNFSLVCILIKICFETGPPCLTLVTSIVMKQHKLPTLHWSKALKTTRK